MSKVSRNLHRPLGEVITEMMKLRFSDIVDVAFTARMEESLDRVGGAGRTGRTYWPVLSRFRGRPQEAEEDLGRIKIPDEDRCRLRTAAGKW